MLSNINIKKELELVQSKQENQLLELVNDQLLNDQKIELSIQKKPKPMCLCRLTDLLIIMIKMCMILMPLNQLLLNIGYDFYQLNISKMTRSYFKTKNLEKQNSKH